MFGSGKSLGPKKIWVLKNFATQKILCPEKILRPIKLSPKFYILCLKKFLVLKMLGLERCWAHINVGYQKMFGPKKYLVLKILGPEKSLGTQKI